jgi:Trk K+ transport system NAD-binding subunit
MIKQQKKLFDDQEERDTSIVNDPEYRLQRGDKVVLFGSDENIRKLASI